MYPTTVNPGKGCLKVKLLDVVQVGVDPLKKPTLGRRQDAGLLHFLVVSGYLAAATDIVWRAGHRLTPRTGVKWMIHSPELTQRCVFPEVVPHIPSAGPGPCALPRDWRPRHGPSITAGLNLPVSGTAPCRRASRRRCPAGAGTDRPRRRELAQGPVKALAPCDPNGPAEGG